MQTDDTSDVLADEEPQQDQEIQEQRNRNEENARLQESIQKHPLLLIADMLFTSCHSFFRTFSTSDLRIEIDGIDSSDLFFYVRLRNDLILKIPFETNNFMLNQQCLQSTLHILDTLVQDCIFRLRKEQAMDDPEEVTRLFPYITEELRSSHTVFETTEFHKGLVQLFYDSLFDAVIITLDDVREKKLQLERTTLEKKTLSIQSVLQWISESELTFFRPQRKEQVKTDMTPAIYFKPAAENTSITIETILDNLFFPIPTIHSLDILIPQLKTKCMAVLHTHPFSSFLFLLDQIEYFLLQIKRYDETIILAHSTPVRKEKRKYEHIREVFYPIVKRTKLQEEQQFQEKMYLFSQVTQSK
jgi:hypothetical protein